MLFQQGKLLSELSTFGIGGPCRFFTEISTIEQMQNTLGYCYREKLPFFILGKGSNTLFDDRGFNGLIILNKINMCEHDGPDALVGSGYSFSLLGVQTARKGWSGLEFASGIPATVGGAIYMNAGANGAETCDHLNEVCFVAETGDLHILPKNKMTFGYRYSCFQEMKGAIVSAHFVLIKSDEARAKQFKIIEYRTKTQPYGSQSAGCVFRNPQEMPAGALIEQCGLKGTSIGGAEVSPMHANFLINKGGATAQNILDLIAHVQDTVREKTGINLEMEIRRIPYDLSS